MADLLFWSVRVVFGFFLLIDLLLPSVRALRLGTPAVTTRGMKESEMRVLGDCIARVIENYRDASVLAGVRSDVSDLVEEFPLYPGLSVLQ